VGSGVGITEIVDNKEIRRLVSYLGAFKVVEGDLGLFDELARVKDIKHFADVLNKFLRVKDRVVSKLIEGIKNGDYEVSALGEVKEGPIDERIRKVFDIGSEVVKEILRVAEGDPHFVATVISSLALAYSGIRSRR